MPIVPTPLTDASPLDLASAAYVTGILSAGGVTLDASQSAALPGLLTAASREIIRHLGNRPIAAAAYSEIVTPEGGRWDRGEPPTAMLGRFPVASITRCATGRTTALVVRNTSTANQEATVSFRSEGDVDFDNLVYTGLVLSRTASGTQATDTVPWTTSSPFTTIAGVAAAINALGGGWTATATAGGTPDVSLLPAAYLVGAREPKDAMNGGASLDAFATPYNGYSIDRSTGILRCSGLSSGTLWGNAFEDWGEGGGGGYFGYPQVEVRYRAGWEVVPNQLQLVVAEMVKLMLARLDQDPSLQSETTGKYSYTIRDAMANLSDSAMATLGSYRDWKV